MTSTETVDFFLGLALVLLAARISGWISARFGQPAVVGEIVAGIGLGAVLAHGSTRVDLLIGENRALLTAVADVGLAAFMFGMGLEIASTGLGSRQRPVLVAIGSVAVPLAGGAGIALAFAHRYAVGSPAVFVAFVATAMSVTALPVMARILADNALTATPAGRAALAAASLGDAFAWICLAGIAVVAGGGSTGWRVALTPVYLALLVCVVRLALRRVLTRPTTSRAGGAGGTHTAVLVVALAASCGAAEWIGLHFIFGAFALGAVVPRRGTDEPRERLGKEFGVAAGMFMPVYFLLTGAALDLRTVTAAAVPVLLAVLATAIATKFAGAYGGARAAGMGTHDAATVATLMNARGLTEIVILNVGRQLGILDATFYAILLIMALLTTASTGPLLAALRRRAARPPTSRDEDGRRTKRGRSSLMSRS